MHTALVQRLMRDRSAWELAHGYDEVAEPEAGCGAVADRRLFRNSVVLLRGWVLVNCGEFVVICMASYARLRAVAGMRSLAAIALGSNLDSDLWGSRGESGGGDAVDSGAG